MAAKEERKIYYMAYDRSHWNHYGAYVGYLALMENLKKQIYDIKILGEEKFVIKPVAQKTSLVSGGFQAIEEDCKITPIDKRTAKSDKSFFDHIHYQSNDMD